MKKFNEKDTRQFYRWLNHRPDEFTEIRILGWPPPGPVIQRWVQNEDDFIKLCREWSGKRQVYAGINPRFRESGANEDVARVIAIPLDIDSIRPSKDVAATEAELAAAKERMIEINSWIQIQGYQPPFIAMSGNGYHIVQRVNIPITEDLSTKVLSSKLESYFFNEVPGAEKMDKILDASRIIKIPGTLSIKGVPTEERPHRLSYIVNEGDPNTDDKLGAHINELEPYVPTPQIYVPTPTATTVTIKKRRTGSIRPCFKRFAEEGGKLSADGKEDNNLRLALVTEAHFKGYNMKQIIDLFSACEDWDEKITTYNVERQLGKIAVEGLKIWSCRAIHKHGGCLGETCKRYKKFVAKYIPTPPPDPGKPVSPDSFFDGQDNFIPSYMVDYIIQTTGENHLLTPTTDKGGDITWRYHSRLGIFRPDGVAYIEKEAKHLLGDKVKRYMISEVVKLTQIETYIDRDQFEEDHDVLVLKNGVYHFDTRELTEHSPQYHAKATLPVIYDPDAKCPVILKFLSEVIPADVTTFQEWVGYHLIKDYRWAKLLILIGDGENGKSKLLLLLVAFIGNSNVVSVELIELITNRFKKAELYGKLANIAPDLGAEELKYTGRLKSLTGDDYIEAAKKHQHPFRFRNYAKLSFSTNKLPRSPDRSRAWFRRPLIMKCPNVFVGDDCDPNILDKITTPQELSGMLNWALEGRRRLIEQGNFTRSETAEQIQELYEELEDDITAFINHCVDTDETDGIVVKDDFYKLYYQFCKMRGFAPILKQTFGKAIKPRIVNLGEGIRKIVKKRETCWTGILMKPDLTRKGCKGCNGSIACISTRRKYNIYKGKYRTPNSPITPNSEGENKPENGFSPSSSELSSSIIQELISTIKAQGRVIPEWPVLFLERHGIPHDKAINILEGLRAVNKLVQRDDENWEVLG